MLIRRIVKFIVKSSIILLGIIIGLDFIPVKFAENKNLVQNRPNAYVCSYVQTTGGNFCASMNDNPKKEKTFYFEINDYPFDILSEKYRKEYEEPTGQQYVFYGLISEMNVVESTADCKIEIEDWAMVYPILRPSYRVLYAPKGYLTIYDFDWGEILRRVFT